MTLPILGLHHVTSKSCDPRLTDQFWRGVMGLRRIKKTVNFDNPRVYHLYFGNEAAEPGTVMTYFPFPGLAQGSRGVGEVSEVSLAVPPGALDFWEARLEAAGAGAVSREEVFGEDCLTLEAPDGDVFRLIERAHDPRLPRTGSTGVVGFDGVTLKLAEADSTAEILTEFGYNFVSEDGTRSRFHLATARGAGHVDLDVSPNTPKAVEGAGSVHHVAFAVRDRAAQAEVRDAMIAAGHKVTHVYDRNYFYAIYFRTPGGVLFEVATHEPGFDVDEDLAHLGGALKLPAQHEHLRSALAQDLIPID